jgi:hypothetical protein
VGGFADGPIRTCFSVRFCAAVGRIADVSDQIARPI